MSDEQDEKDIEELCKILDSYATKNKCEKCGYEWVQMTKNGCKRELQSCHQCGPIKYQELTPEILEKLRDMSQNERLMAFAMKRSKNESLQ